MYSVRKKYYLCVITIIFFVSCTTQKKYEVLSFFFDGVPNPQTADIDLVADSLSVKDSTTLLAKSNGVAKPGFQIHSPYGKKECVSCHDQKSIGKTIDSQPQLCYKCHTDYKESSRVVHGPVGGGYCSNCHDPHKSQLEKLLKQPAEQLCLHCHDSTTIYTSKFHINSDKNTCIECHNPHGGENRFMPQHGSCYNCHNNYAKIYDFLHGPVAGEYCSACHSAHIENTPNLLLYNDNQICLNCHDKKVIYASEYHKNKESDCITCHNPHGGKNRFFTK
ncbi:MAG: cytochrome c3 family protein [Bacteroidales bacterium]|nr:cytochrome c3 family protein [Bacteroidales bacterium]